MSKFMTGMLLFILSIISTDRALAQSCNASAAAASLCTKEKVSLVKTSETPATTISCQAAPSKAVSKSEAGSTSVRFLFASLLALPLRAIADLSAKCTGSSTSSQACDPSKCSPECLAICDPSKCDISKCKK